MRIALFSDHQRWHETELITAFAKRDVEAVLVSLTDCAIGYGPASCYGLSIPGFTKKLPDAVFVRHIPGGSFEQITFRLDILHALQHCAVEVYNSARMIERTVDKAMTSFLLNKAGIAAAPAWVSEQPQQSQEQLSQGPEWVLKPLFGSRGQGLQRLKNNTLLPDPTNCNGVYYLQKFIPSATDYTRDWRVFVIGGKAVAAMERHAEQWITNRSQGGICKITELSKPLAELAEAGVAAVGTRYAGVDIISDVNGNYLILEINGIPAWRGLQAVNSTNIAQLLADDLITYL